MGIIFYFYSNDHIPIHIHAKCKGRESKAELYFSNGKLIKIKIIDNGPGLDPSSKKILEELATIKAEDIATKWSDYFIKNKHIVPEYIARKLKHG